MARRARVEAEVRVSLRAHWPWLALLALSAVLHLWGLGERSFHHDESIHAKLSWDISEGRAYQYNPTYHGPLLYYVTAAVLFVADNDFTARLPIALAGIAMIWVAWGLRRPFGERAAWWTGLLFTVSPLLLFFGRFLRMDLLEMLTASAALLAWHWVLRDAPRAWIGLGIWTGLAFATNENAYVTSALVTATGLEMALVVGLRRCLQRSSRRARVVGLVLAVAVAVAGLLGLVLSTKLLLVAAAVVGLGLVVALGVGLGEALPLALAWLRARWPWMAGAVALFVLVTVPLYTVFFTRPDDWLFPLNAVSYWWGQHTIQRVGGPWWFHLPRLVQYEFLILGASTVWVVRRARRLRPVELFLYLFGLSSIAMYAYLGEKVPWLGVHQIWSLVPLAGAQLARTVGPRGRWWSRCLIAAGLAATLIVSLIASFVLDEISPRRERVESLHFVQTCPELKQVVREGLALNDGSEPTVAAASGEAVWPLTWYWRHIPVWWSTPQSGARPPLVVCDFGNEAGVVKSLGGGYRQERIPLRAWWLMEQWDPDRVGLRRWLEEGADPAKLGRTRAAGVVRYLLTRKPWSLIGSTDVVVLRRGGQTLPEPREATVPEALRSALGVTSARVVAEGWLGEPRGVASSGDRIAVADVGLSRVVIVDRDGKVLAASVRPGLEQPEAVAWLDPGTVLIADTWNHRLLRVDVKDGSTTVLREPDGGWYGPRSVAVGPDLRIAVADTGNRRIIVYSAGLEVERIVVNAGDAGAFSEPGGLVWLGTSSLLVCDTGHRRLVVLDPDRGSGQEIALPEAWPDYYSRPQITVLAAGRWLASDTSGAALWLVEDGKVQRIALSEDGIVPTGVAWEPDSKTLVLADLKNRLWVLETVDG